MIVGICGYIVKKEPTTLHIELSNGLIYKVEVSLNCSAKIADNSIKLFTTYIVKEDSQKLYGFLEEDEKELFDTLIKISGIGPSTALAVCSTLTPKEFIVALENQDITLFKKVPGIGPKSAKRLVVELSDFTPTSAKSTTTVLDNNKDRALMALESLGFKKESIKKAIKSSNSSETEDIIKDALKVLR
jgi:Holliday junction DNA helicase RuvA